MNFSVLIATLLLFISVVLAKEEWQECEDKSGEDCKRSYTYMAMTLLRQRCEDSD